MELEAQILVIEFKINRAEYLCSYLFIVFYFNFVSYKNVCPSIYFLFQNLQGYYKCCVDTNIFQFWFKMIKLRGGNLTQIKKEKVFKVQ